MYEVHDKFMKRKALEIHMRKRTWYACMTWKTLCYISSATLPLSLEIMKITCSLLLLLFIYITQMYGYKYKWKNKLFFCVIRSTEKWVRIFLSVIYLFFLSSFLCRFSLHDTPPLSENKEYIRAFLYIRNFTIKSVTTGA